MIISIIIKILNTLNKFVWKLTIFLAKFIKIEELKHIDSKPNDIRYRQFKVDEPALFEPFKQLDKLDYKQLIEDNNIKPIKRHNGKGISFNGCCPRCNAPKDYLYDNSGKGIQFQCKACSHLFNLSVLNKNDITLRCPHCHFALILYHQRDDFNVYKCCNMKCSYYLKNKNSMNTKDLHKFKDNPTLFKLHYIYRTFNIDAPTLNKDFRDFVRTPIDISKAYHSKHVIGLCLTYHVNYGLSYRATAAIMHDIHLVSISHQTVKNYCDAVAHIVHPVLEFYPYDLSEFIAGDETYVRIMGKWHYNFFMFDTVKKIITSYRCFEKRDAISAIKTVYNTLAKYDNLPKNLTMFFDGNPIYNVAHQYWSHNGYPFDLIQIIGLKNRDPISKKYRSYKQISERLNRTFKFYYKPTNGLGSIYDANTYNILFATCFNFLRPHSALDYKVPQYIESVQKKGLMPSKWIELINLGFQYINIYS